MDNSVVMTTFSELMKSMSHVRDNIWHIHIPEGWMQGRTTYGGLSAALCLESVYRAFGKLPPLRSAQINFIGPAGGTVQICSRVVRRGKSVCFIAVEIEGERGPATHAYFCFGSTRESKLDRVLIERPEVPEPRESEVFIPEGYGPPFMQHYEQRLALGARPVAGSEVSDHSIWVRHKDEKASGSVALLALADMPPPAILSTLTEMPPLSSMTWMLNFLSTEHLNEGGWWLLRTFAEHACDGYSSQNMMVWNRQGDAVIAGRQNIALFY